VEKESEVKQRQHNFLSRALKSQYAHGDGELQPRKNLYGS
jgi:hypothetical protein